MDIPKLGITRFDISEVKFNRKEAKKLKSETTEEEKAHKDLEKE